MNEYGLSFENGRGERLQGVLVEAADSRGCVVMCYPFADERKYAQPAYVRIARRLGGAGISSLRFDYAGCGHSDGCFERASLAGWVADSAEAIRHAAARCLGRPMLLGLRLGANIAVRAALAEPAGTPGLLWNPLLDTGRYIAGQLRSHAIGRIMGRAPADVARPADPGTTDLAGYRIGPAMLRELQSGQLNVALPLREGLAVGCAHPDPARMGGALGRAVTLAAPPFWGLACVEGLDEFVARTVEHFEGAIA